MAIDKNAVTKEAQKYIAKGQFDKAIAEWKKLLKETPDDPNIYNTIGDLCLKKNSKNEAVDAYQKAADILAADGFASKAIALYKKVLNIDPQKIEAHLALGDMNAEKGLTGNALESYKIVADHYTKQNQKAKALGIYQKMADLNPSNLSFRIKLADMYIKEGMKKEAVAAYLAAADVHLSKDAFQDARQLFEKILALDPDNKEVYHKAGIVYIKEGKFAEACKALKPAFEHEPGNQELADLYLDALTKTGKTGDAEEVLKKLLELDAERLDLREKLLRLYVTREEFGPAAAEALLVANAKVASGEGAAAEAFFTGLLNDVPDAAPIRRAAADFYVTIDKPAEAAREFLKAGEQYLAVGDRETAQDVLSRAIELAPDLEEARRRLDELTAPPPVEEAPASESSAAMAEPEDMMPPALEASDVIELPSSPMEAPSYEAAPPEPEEQPAVEALDPVVTEAMTEVDVLIKYGLAPKALEQLEDLSRRYPDTPEVRTRLRDLHRDQGNAEKAVLQCLMLAEFYSTQGRMEEADGELRTALDISPGNAAIMARLGMAPAPQEEAPPAEPDLAAPFGGFELPQTDFGFTEPTTPVTEDIGFSGDGLAPPPDGFAEPPPEIAATEPTSFEAPPAEETPVSEEPPPSLHEASAPPSAPEQVAEEPAPPLPEYTERPAPPPAAAEPDIHELWAEAEFYYQQGLFDEARRHYALILQRNPDDNRALKRLVEVSREKEEVQEFSKLADAVEGLEGFAPSDAAEGALATSESDEEAVRSLMQEIQALQKADTPAPPPPRPAPPKQPVAERSSEPAGVGDEADFFDVNWELDKKATTPPAAPARGGEEDFFDLAAELREELTTAPAGSSAPPSEEQSLDEIFEEFKKGVEEQANKEDTDTHYNLGVAYKEMGLLDDAISEFSMTSAGEPRYIQSRNMLGLCYLEKENYQSAADELQTALQASYGKGESDEDRIGMHYDLGLAYQGAGNADAALNEFKKVHELDGDYRDVAHKLRELRQGDFVSLDDLKADIEKEISAKFFEEGERIEREEKTRRAEKIKN